MKTVIKILIVVVIMVACFNVGRALLSEYQFEDAVHDALLFDPRMTDVEITKMVMENAEKFNIDMAADDVQISQQGPDVHVDMSYTTTIVIIPGVFSKEWVFTPSTSTRILLGNRRKPS